MITPVYMIVDRHKGLLTIILAFCLVAVSSNLLAQSNLLGQKGYIIVPSAELYDDREYYFAVASNHQNHRLLYRDFDTRVTHELFYTLGVGILPRINLSITLGRLLDTTPDDRIGIGDRSANIGILVLKEKKFLPSLAVNLSPFVASSNQYIATNNVVISKAFEVHRLLSLETTAGYGIDRVLGVFEGQVSLNKKNSDFLTGVFGAIAIRFDDRFQFNAEYDGNRLNTGVGVIFKQVSAGLYLQGNSGVGFSFLFRDFVK